MICTVVLYEVSERFPAWFYQQSSLIRHSKSTNIFIDSTKRQQSCGFFARYLTNNIPGSNNASLLYTGSTAFVVRAPNVAAASSRWWSATPRLSSSSRLYSTTPARAPWTCLAPGGKVGRQKVSLERAVTSIAAPKPQEKQEQEVSKANINDFSERSDVYFF